MEQIIKQKIQLILSLHTLSLIGYWTSARESRDPTMFVWNDTETHLDPYVISGWNSNFANGRNYEYCASFRVLKNNSEMYPESCLARNCVLCQN